MSEQVKPSRPAIHQRTRLLVWARAAGRCTFCNVLVVESTQLGEAVPLGELAHNVGWGQGSPRGLDDLPADQRQDDENLILVCRNCHKPIDDGGVAGRYTKDELLRRKREHETRIEALTTIGADRSAYVLRIVGEIRGIFPELTRETVLAATTAAGIYPRILPGAHWDSNVDLDLRQARHLESRSDFESLLPQIKAFTDRVHDGVRKDAVARLAVFGFARIPVLIALGAHLDDKVPTQIFQRQRRDDHNAWTWPKEAGQRIDFNITRTRSGDVLQSVALVLNLSGTIAVKDIADTISIRHNIYTITPSRPMEPSPTLIRSPAHLASLEATLRKFLAQIEADHGHLESIDVFPAIGLSAAITMGRVLMPDVSPAWNVFDRAQGGKFFMALSVRRGIDCAAGC